MKKIILIIIICICSISVISYLSRITNPYGYFVKGPKMNCEHSSRASVLELENGNLLILGENLPKERTDSEIYDIQSNKFKTYNLLKEDVYYLPEGLLLENNKLLLTFVHNPKDRYENMEIDYYSKNYNSMAVVDLKTNRVEKYISKKINKKHEPNQYTKFARLGNGNIALVDFENNVVEIYNPISDTSNILNIKFNKDVNSQIIAYDKDKLLIFGESDVTDKRNKNTKSEDKDYVLEYNDTLKTIKPVGYVIRRNSPILHMISSDKILLAGGLLHNEICYNCYSQQVEIFDIPTKKSYIIGNFTDFRASYGNGLSYSGTSIGMGKFIIGGGDAGSPPLGGYSNSTEIIDINNNSIVKGPNMRFGMSYFKMIPLKNGNVICILLGNTADKNFRRLTQLLKLRRQ